MRVPVCLRWAIGCAILQPTAANFGDWVPPKLGDLPGHPAHQKRVPLKKAEVSSMQLKEMKLGALLVNNVTLPKLVHYAGRVADATLLVKFEQPPRAKTAHGVENLEGRKWYDEDMDVFVQLLERLNHIERLTFASIEVPWEDSSSYGPHIMEKYGLDEDRLPTYKVFNAAQPEGAEYRGALRFDDLSVWLHVKSALEGFEQTHDTLQDFDALVSLFVKGEEQQAIDRAAALADKTNDAKADMYVRYMRKLREVAPKGSEYLRKELDRISLILEHHLPSDTRTEMSEKIRVLNVFKRGLQAQGRGSEL